MATNNDKNTTKSTTSAPPKAPPVPAGKPAGQGMSAAQAKADTGKERIVRVWLASAVNPELKFKVRQVYLDKYGTPEHGGKPMVVINVRGGFTADPNRKAAKEAREAQLAAMTPDEKMAFLAKERETRKASKLAKKEAELSALKAKLRAELEAELAAKK